MQKRKRNKVVAVSAVVTVAVTAIASKTRRLDLKGKYDSSVNRWRREETLVMLRIISPGDSQRYKEKESERKQPKLQQYLGLIDVVVRFREIMKQIIEEEKKKPKVMLPRQYKEYSNKDGPLFFYSSMNYRPTPIPRPKDLDLSEEQWEQFDGDVREGVVPFVFDQRTTSKHGRISQTDHTSQDYQTSVREWLDSLTDTPKITNQYPKQLQDQSYSQQNKLYNQKQKVKIKNNKQMNQKESQLIEQMTMETMTNLSSQSNLNISLTETMNSKKMTAGRSYRQFSTEK
ncbi:MAG: hypothetical protein EZS28_011435 [Streblomastix strix]|uniref:Uncharacterized protein n=1 Tax=Streblomastix strix TaxID=222440 RepID=A0A5J4WFB7_9EUKA|nr:MAG: hypothetical protein EZS28_011435 [Streblomastix strix]